MRCAAHRVKGETGTLGAKAAFESALRLETMGRTGELIHADEAYAELEQALARLQPVLARLQDDTTWTD
jgi:HPt (histidine-containing phosphotransfer) domain-containing protein